jgi:hypothetical protein
MVKAIYYYPHHPDEEREILGLARFVASEAAEGEAHSTEESHSPTL